MEIYPFVVLLSSLTINNVDTAQKYLGVHGDF